MSVKQVSSERWREAQEWEYARFEKPVRKRGWKRAIWPIARPILRLLGSRRVEGNDWNYWWARQFEGYGFLPSDLDNYVELGCGPHTNTRIILQGRKVGHVVCSDPLARKYIMLKHTWLSKQHRKGAVMIDDRPIEECPFASDYFDVVVLINVLDHVMDADLCLRSAVRIAKPGGYLLVGQDLSNEEDARRTALSVGHPMKLTLEDLEAHFQGFEAILRKVLPREQGRGPAVHYATLVFAGQKRRAPNGAAREWSDDVQNVRAGMAFQEGAPAEAHQ